MDRNEAKEMAGLFREIGGFTEIKVAQRGGEFAAPDSPWEVELWCVNAKSGNRNLELVEEYLPGLAKSIARKAKGKANKRDQEAFARIAAENELN